MAARVDVGRGFPQGPDPRRARAVPQPAVQPRDAAPFRGPLAACGHFSDMTPRHARLESARVTSPNHQADQYSALAETGAPRPLRVLVVDDERDSVLTLMLLLQDEGHEVRGVSTGRQAISALPGFDP